METGFFGFIVIVIVSIMIFLLCREIVCWCFKINEFIKINKEILFEIQKKNDIQPKSNDD